MSTGATPELRAWVEKDLASAKDSTWRFVSFHHPGFNSAEKHFEQQEMRLMADVFERRQGRRGLQRPRPQLSADLPPQVRRREGRPTAGWSATKDLVPGTWTLDKAFDGATDTTPEGVIYLVTGAGGASLYNPEMQDKPETWREFTNKFISKLHSVTVAEVDGGKLTIRQLSADGEVLDRFIVTK